MQGDINSSKTHFIVLQLAKNENHIKFLYTKITEVYLSTFASRLFHEDFSSILGAKSD